MTRSGRGMASLGTKISDPRFEGVELGQRAPDTAVQLAEGNHWAPPFQERTERLGVRGGWADERPRERSLMDQRVYCWVEVGVRVRIRRKE